MTEATGTPEGAARGRRKMRLGVVVSDKMQKTVVVQFTRQFGYPVYGKQVTRTKGVKAHNDKDARIGDTVRLMETRPISKDKRWRVVEIVIRAK